jgi:hypothetical protein
MSGQNSRTVNARRTAVVASGFNGYLKMDVLEMLDCGHIVRP